MSKYRITTCPHCKKEFEEEIRRTDFIIENSDFSHHPDGTLTHKVEHLPKPNLKKCPLCKKMINLDNPDEYKHRYEYRTDSIISSWQRFKKAFDKFLP